MSDSYGSRGPRNYDSNENQIFVSGIPIDVDKGGLYSLFSQAGHVDNIKIIPSKNPSHTTTFGFVRFKTMSSAAQAIQMFDGYKIGTKQLAVRISNTPGSVASSSSTSNVGERKSTSNDKKGAAESGMFDDWSQDEEKSGLATARHNQLTKTNTVTSSLTNVSAIRDDHGSSRGRGRMMDNSGRPYANDTVSNPSDNTRPRPMQNNQRGGSTTGSESAFTLVNEQRRPIINNDEPQLKVGKEYEVVVTQVKSPSNFLIAVLNLPNSYKTSYRCKLDMQPLKGESEWSRDTIGAFEKFQNLDDLITAEVMRVERFQNEPIYVVDLYYGGEESVIEHFVRKNLASKTTTKNNNKLDETTLSNSDSDWSRHYLIKKSTTQKYLQSLARINRKKMLTRRGSGNQQQEYEADTEEEDDDDDDDEENTSVVYSTTQDVGGDGVMIPSVSMGDLNLVGECNDYMGRINQERITANTVLSSAADLSSEAYLNHVAPMSRNKMFNGLFKIWKRRDINPMIQKYKCGQVLNVRMAHLGDSATFYTHEYRRLDDLMTVEASIQNYARVLITSDELRSELQSFQHNAAKFDLVLARSTWDNQWRRAVIMERVSSENLGEEEDNSTQIPSSGARIYHTFFMIDWGRTDTYVQTNDRRGDLFILPMNAKLLAIGAFALKCSINQCHVRFRETIVPNARLEELNAERRREFEAAFRARLKEEPLLKMRITQIVNVKNDVQAIVELYFFPDEKQAVERKHHDVLNCVKSILDELDYLNVSDYEGEFGGDDDSTRVFSDDESKMESPDNKENINDRKKLDDLIKPKAAATVVPPQQQEPVKKQPLAEHDLNRQPQTTPQSVADKQKILKINFAQLEPAKSNTVMFQYEEETHEHFFVALKDQFENLAFVQNRLQEEADNEKLFTYITSVNQVKVGDHLEALFDQDATWYRVSVLHLDEAKRALDVYFLDYGNTQRLADLGGERKLRRRNYALESDENRKILSLDYQAIKCFYYSTHSGHRERNELFLEKLADLDIDQGVKIRVVETKLDSLSKTYIKPNIIYGVDLDEGKFAELSVVDKHHQQQTGAQPKKSTAGSCVSASDREVRQILESKPDAANEQEELIAAKAATPAVVAQKQPTKSSSCTKYSIFSMSHILPNKAEMRDELLPQKVIVVLLEDLDEFYVQLANEVTEHFVEQDQNVKDLIRSMNRKKAVHGGFEIGDLVYAQFIDSEWYRAIIVGKNARNKQAGTEATDLDETCDDSSVFTSHNASSTAAGGSTSAITYEVHFMDYGNRHTILCGASELCPIEALLEHARTSGCEASVRETIDLPVQALCCRLDDRIARTPDNLELLQKMAAADAFFDVARLSAIGSLELIPAAIDRQRISLIKYVVSLAHDDKNVDDLLEKKKEEPKPLEKPKTNEVKPKVEEKPVEKVKVEEKPKLEEKPKVVEQATKPQAQPQPAVNLNSNELMTGKTYKCKLADINMETGVIFVNLVDDSNKQSQLEASLKAIEKVPISAKLVNPSVGDLVLAKYYLDENRREYSWYRAVIDSKDVASGCFGVLYIDYGNQESGLDAAEMDIVRIPEKYSLRSYAPPFAYKIRLDNVPGFNLDEHAALLEEFLVGSTDENHSFNIRVVARGEEKSSALKPDLVAYDVELWNADNSKCLNAIIRKDEPKEEGKPSPKIDESSLNQAVKELPTTLKGHMIFLDDFEKPIFFALTSDIYKQEDLMSRLNDVYTRSKSHQIDSFDSLTVDSYIAALSEGNWYRVQVKSVDASARSCSVFFIDYGYEDTINEAEIAERVRSLDAAFLDEPRLVFGGLLSARDQENPLETGRIDTDALQAIVESFFTTGDSKELLNVKIIGEFNKPNLFANEKLYLVKMRNESDVCLNDLFENVIVKEKRPKSRLDEILDEKKKKSALTPPPPPAPPKRPVLKPLNLADIPQQKGLAQLNKNKNEQYIVFSRSIELFYVFSTNVELIQSAVQQTCKEMLEELESYASYKEDELSRRPQVGDLVFGQYELDGAWYRCVVTNCDETRTNYELFYMDFGNTELATYSPTSLLVPWRESHTRVLREYEPQAYKCSLYGVTRRGKSTDDDNEKFKAFTKNRLFSVRFLTENKDGLFGVCLDEIISDSKSSFATAHIFAINEKLGDFKRFNEILENVRTPQEIEFYTELLKNYQSLKDTA